MKTLLVWPPFNDPKYLPLGLGYIAGAVTEAGHEARILDLNAAFYAALRRHQGRDPDAVGPWCWDEDLARAMSGMAFAGDGDPGHDGGSPPNPPGAGGEAGALAEVIRAAMEPALREALHGVDLVGVSVTETGLLGAIYVSKLVRAAGSTAPIVWGGPQCSARIGPVLMRALGVMDLVIHGDGEAPVQALLEQLAGERDLARVPGLIWRDGDAIRANASPSRSASLDGAPRPDFSSITRSDYPLLVLPVLASRGCAWNRCTFCSEPMIWPEVRQRTARDVVAEIREGVERLQPAWVSFGDTAANGRPDGISAVVDEMIAQGLRIRWDAIILAQSVDRDLFARMKRTGCTDLFVGLESLDDDLLRLMKKGVTFVHTLRVLKLAAEQGIKMTSNLITSFPGETAAHLRRTAARLERYAYLFGGGLPSLVPFVAQQGAAVYEEPDRYGARILGASSIARTFPARVQAEPMFWSYDWERLEEPAGEAAEREAALRDLAQTVDRLRQAEPLRMRYWDDPAGGRVHVETARGSRVEETRIEGEEREVFLACDEITSVRSLSEATGRSPDDLRAVAARLEHRALVAVSSSGMIMSTVPRGLVGPPVEAARPHEARSAGGKIHLALA